MTQRLDIAMVERGLVPTRSKAQALIMAGVVRVNHQLAQKAGDQVVSDSQIDVIQRPRFASRGGEKLDHGLELFEIDVTDAVCADIGASTGGFTDALLQRQAARVYAIDVGYGQIALEMRNDPRVVVMDRTNARFLESLPEPVDLVVVDASFISLSKLFPAITRISKPAAAVVALIKPQFEAGKKDVGKHGVVRDNTIHARVLLDIVSSATEHHLSLAGLTASPLKGPAGNIEFLGHFVRSTTGEPLIDVNDTVTAAIDEAPR